MDILSPSSSITIPSFSKMTDDGSEFIGSSVPGYYIQTSDTSPIFKRTVSILSLDEFVHSEDEYTLDSQVSTSKRQLQSSDCAEVSDDESCCCTDDAFERPKKRLRVDKKKSVRFAEELTTAKVLHESKSIPALKSDMYSELFWSKKELQEFQTDCKITQSTDYEVQEYVEAFRVLEDSVMKSDLTMGSSADFDTFLDGLKDGWLGLECYGTNNAVRKSRTRQYVRTVIATQHSCPHKLGEIATNLSAPSVRWVVALGNATHIAAED
jgi:hypothetical protein